MKIKIELKKPVKYATIIKHSSCDFSQVTAKEIIRSLAILSWYINTCNRGYEYKIQGSNGKNFLNYTHVRSNAKYSIELIQIELQKRQITDYEIDICFWI